MIGRGQDKKRTRKGQEKDEGRTEEDKNRKRVEKSRTWTGPDEDMSRRGEGRGGQNKIGQEQDKY